MKRFGIAEEPKHLALPVRSPVPAGEMASLELTRLGRAAGCRLITAADIPGRRLVGPLWQDEPVLPDSSVRYAGQAVALAVVPSSPAAAPEIKVDSLALLRMTSGAAMTSLEEVLSEAHAGLERRTICVETAGDRERTRELLQSARHAVSGAYSFPSTMHAYLEPDYACAEYDGETLTVVTPTQAPFELRRTIAGVLALPEERVIIQPPPIGGAFGGRLDLLMPCQAALAAFITRSSVLLGATPAEQRRFGPRSNAINARVRVGSDEAGRLLAIQLSLDVDAGAYSSYGPAVIKRMLAHASGPYDFDAVHTVARLLWTNTRPASAFRGFGVGPLTVVVEDQVRALSECCGMDELEFRRLNSAPRTSARGPWQSMDPGSSKARCLDQADMLRQKLNTPLPTRPADTRRSTGIAFFAYGIGNTGQANPATVRLVHDGGARFLLLTSTVDMGQGSHAVLRRICAKRLGTSPDDIRVLAHSTAMAPDSGKTSASRTAHFVGNAVLNAADRLISVACEVVMRHPGWRSASWREGCFLALPRSGEPQSLSFDDIARLDGGHLVAEGTYAPCLGEGVGRYYPTYAFGCTIATIELDIATGAMRVLRLGAVHDVGELVDRDGATGQVAGGAAMGIALALASQASSQNLLTMKEMPEVDAWFIEDDGEAKVRKGLGEPAMVGVAAAIHNAYRNIVSRDDRMVSWAPHMVQRWRTDAVTPNAKRSSAE